MCFQKPKNGVKKSVKRGPKGGPEIPLFGSFWGPFWHKKWLRAYLWDLPLGRDHKGMLNSIPPPPFWTLWSIGAERPGQGCPLPVSGSDIKGTEGARLHPIMQISTHLTVEVGSPIQLSWEVQRRDHSDPLQGYEEHDVLSTL